MGLEYYYLFGVNIPLHKYNLGEIKQPKIRDYLNKQIDMDTFYFPFLMNDVIIKQSDNKDELLSIKNQLGSLTFLLYMCTQFGREDVLNTLKSSIEIIYDDTACIDIEDFKSIAVGDIIIDNSNFNILSDIILEMMHVDKSKIKLDKPLNEEMDEITKRFEMLRNKHKERTKGSKSELELVDMMNFIIHSNECAMNHDRVLNMTMYQVKNAIETLYIKNNYETMLQYKLSQKFDIKEDVKLWSSKKIIKNSLIKEDV